MRKEEITTPDQLMRPDLLSEIVLLGSGVSILMALIMIFLAAYSSSGIQ